MVRKRFDRFGAKVIRYDIQWQPKTIKPATDLKNIKLPQFPADSPLDPSRNEELDPAVVSTTLTPPGIEQPPLKPPARSRRKKRRARTWRWSLLWLGMLSLCGGMGAVALLWLTTLPPLPDCQKISPIAADSERLFCAQEAARSGDLPELLAGLRLVQNWGPDHPLYGEAQGLIARWSTEILAIANEKINQNDLPGAVETAQQIPENSPVYEKAEKAIATWQEQWKQGESIYKTAQDAILKQDWKLASEQIPALAQLESPYWQKLSDDLTQQVLTEKQARLQLTEAQKLAKTNRPSQLGKALELVQQIDPKTHAWNDAKAERVKWSQALITAGLKQLQEGDLKDAIAYVQQAPPDPTLTPEAADLVRYSHAQKMAGWSDAQWQPSFHQLWGLLEAMSAAQNIESDSLFYSAAQTNIKTWQGRLDDLIQLQFASLLASMDQRFTIELAINQAEQIGADRPRRLQAQTLAAHWKQEIQRLEDRPYLARARELAQDGTIPALRLAIAQASVIPLNRALRLEAQSAIAMWNRQIETIEDKPFMDEARTLAEQGKLRDAIASAEKIRSGRALYAEAQSSIRNWRAQIQIAEDRPILNEAYELAAQGSLSAAIDVASQIGRGRALYGEARSAIAQWRIEREAIWDMWAAEAEQDSYDSYDSYDSGYEDDGSY